MLASLSCWGKQVVDLSKLSIAERKELLVLLEMKDKHQRENRINYYKPYPKQKDHHRAGSLHSERLLIAGNQLGKSVAGAAEWAMHLTGRYPDWWEGATFDKPVAMWASSVTGESTRDNPQRLLVGPPSVEDMWGTGMIPKDAIKDWDRAIGIANLLDNISVKWGGGGDVQAGTSTLGFKSYEKGREKWQGPTLDGVWFDEECPLDIYTEGLTRTNNGQRGQFTIMTFTPLLGMSDVVGLFLQPEAK